MDMKAQLTILMAVLPLVVITTARAQTGGIFGVYGQCNMACRYIKVNPDHTFEELLDGDLFNGQRKQGIWKFNDKRKLIAQSQIPSSILQVRESETAQKGASVTVVDMAGAVIPNSRITAIADGRMFVCVTNEDGICSIPKPSSFEVEWNRFKGSYSVKNQAANRFEVQLTSEQMDTVINEVWLIKGNYLYVEYDGVFDKAQPLKRVSLEEARKLFPLKYRPGS